MKLKINPNEKRSNRIRQAAEVLEEVLWLLDSKRGTSLRELPTVLRRQLDENSDLTAVAGQYASPNPNKHFLIGVLPRLFQDTTLFPSNEDIAEFAQTVLGVPISRFEKRSKYELIGFIVCETNDLDEEKLSHLVRSLADITGSEEKLQRVVEARRDGGLNWNEAIRQIGQVSDDQRE